MSDPFGDTELKFPIEWHYRIICEDVPGAQEAVQGVINDQGLNKTVERGHQSRKGKYVTFTVSITFNDKMSLDLISAALNACPAVKYLI